MASRQARSTAFGAATFKAFEQHVDPPMRLFDDPIGQRLLTGAPAMIMRFAALRTPMRALMERMEPGLIGAMACRTRAIDDAVTQAVTDGARQAVILGAGLDTRAYRLPALTDLPVWELDAPQVQHAKVDAVTRALGAVPSHVRYLPIDFADQAIVDVLGSGSFDAGMKTVVIWEGVSQYLVREDVEQTLRFGGGLQPGSRLIFTYIPQTILDSPARVKTARRLKWHTGMDQQALASYVRPFGLQVIDDLGAAEYRQRYLAATGRHLTVFDTERVAVAEAVTAQTL